MSKNVHVSDINIGYDFSAFDYFPFSFKLDLPNAPLSDDAPHESLGDIFVDWKNFGVEERSIYQSNAEEMLNSLEICNKLGCFDDHRENIDHFYKYYIAGLRESTKPFVFNRPKKFVPVPGWNKHCKYLHRQARDAFKVWVHSGKIRVGPVYEKMK